MAGESQGITIDVVWDGFICPYCGQERNQNAKICSMCQKYMTTVVLALCKDLLYNSGQMKKIVSKNRNRPSEENKESVQELELHRVLDHFPYAFAKRTKTFRKALETEGIWFSHVLAFRFICHLRADKYLSPPMIICDPMYQMVRNQVYDFLQIENPDEDTCEAFNLVYNIPEAEDDGRAVILDMIDELERLKRLKITRPKSHCTKCGKEIQNTRPLCADCEKEESLNNRMTIASGSPQPIVNNQENPSQSVKMRGMHWRNET